MTSRLLAPSATTQGLALHTSVNDEAASHLIVDALRIRQILINLLANAVKFTHAEEVQLQVLVQAETLATKTLRFQVADTVVGLTADAQKTSVCKIHAGRRVNNATLRRHRTWVSDLQRTSPTDGRTNWLFKCAGQ